jgi:hypothetical protein
VNCERTPYWQQDIILNLFLRYLPSTVGTERKKSRDRTDCVQPEKLTVNYDSHSSGRHAFLSLILITRSIIFGQERV